MDRKPLTTQRAHPKLDTNNELNISSYITTGKVKDLRNANKHDVYKTRDLNKIRLNYLQNPHLNT